MKKINNFMKIRSLTGAALALLALTPLTSVGATSLEMTDQGSKWNDHVRNKYYTEDQGSRVIPLKWINALKQDNGAPFMANSLTRYGYLPNPKSPEPGLPVGFMATDYKGQKVMGLTCSACHTRQIEVDDIAYRIDGGPAITDIQTFFADLDKAVNKVLTDQATFTDFAHAVLGSSASKADQDKLHADVDTWFKPYHEIMHDSLPTESPWGPSRLDAVSMIFNRLTGLDIGTEPDHMIKGNIKKADVPVRYPFLWNAPIQDMTQWPGFSENGNAILGLGRNVGEVIGVFADFHPKRDNSKIYKINYTENNSANFRGLNEQESTIRKLGPPKWPWKLDSKLVATGAEVFKKKDPNEENASCVDCHGIKINGSFWNKTWKTPLVDVGTDSREVNLLSYEVNTGIMSGAMLYPGDTPLKPRDKAFSVLKIAVAGSILQHYLPVDLTPEQQRIRNAIGWLLSKFEQDLKNEVHAIEELGPLGSLDDLKKIYNTKPSDSNSFKYESRVLQGIWATAPYLHNGSVPSLAELLVPSEKRVAEFKIGPAYDIETVGLAKDQSKFDFTLKTTDCKDRNSGNSRCGHDYGTTFSESEKRALLEYLKSL